MAFEPLLVSAAVLLLAGGLFSHFYLRSGDRVDRLGLPQAVPELLARRVSIVVPTRNDAATLERCLLSLARLDHPDYEVVVVDGGSTDGGRGIAERVAAENPRFRVLQEPPLPAGWIGKCWACHEGAKAATGEILLFTDADTFHAPGSLSRSATAVEEGNLEFLTGLTRQELPSLRERIFMPPVFLLIATAVRGLSSENLADERKAIGNGQYLVFTREAYLRTGGHEAVKGEIAEDLHLARLAARHRLRSRFVDLRDEVSVRMYGTFVEMWRGWRKNLSEGAVATPPVATAATVLASWEGAFALPLALLALAMGAPLAALLALAAYAHATARLAFDPSSNAAGLPWALLHPLGFGFFIVTFWTSVLDRVSGRGHEWKGRRYRSRKRSR